MNHLLDRVHSKQQTQSHKAEKSPILFEMKDFSTKVPEPSLEPLPKTLSYSPLYIREYYEPINSTFRKSIRLGVVEIKDYTRPSLSESGQLFKSMNPKDKPISRFAKNYFSVDLSKEDERELIEKETVFNDYINVIIKVNNTKGLGLDKEFDSVTIFKPAENYSNKYFASVTNRDERTFLISKDEYEILITRIRMQTECTYDAEDEEEDVEFF